MNPEHPYQVKRGELEGRVEFHRPYHGPPAVMISLSAVDFIQGSNYRIDVEVTGVDEKGFDYVFYTWYNTKVWYARASWMAVSRLDRVGDSIVIAPVFQADNVLSVGERGMSGQ